MLNYQQIDSIMAKRSLTTDPAFDDVVISIEPIPSFNGCPLGLYYPDQRTIVMPPDGLESALLHELGHRHGHYYYDDLSEKYAEYFRKIYQPKGRALLYRGDQFERLPKFEVLFEEGEKGAVEVALFQPLTHDEIYEIKDRLYSYPEPPPRVYYKNGEFPVVRFEFTKGVDWLTIVGATMAATVVATVGALGYAIYKVSDELPWVVPVALFGTGLFFLLRAMAKEAKVRV